MHLTITHTTRYTYDVPVHYALQKIRLQPRSSALQAMIDWNVTVEGGKIEASYNDHYRNHVDLVSADVDTQHMTITATGQVDPPLRRTRRADC